MNHNIYFYNSVSMFFGFETLAVVAATLVVLAIGVIWYAPQVFGRVWARGLKLDESILEFETPGNIRRLAVAGIINFVIMIFLANLIVFARELNISPLKFMAGLFAILFLVSLLNAVQERRSLVSFCITTVYGAAIIFVGTAVLAYWPW